MACLVAINAGIFDNTDRDLALHLLGRALPLASRSSRMEGFRPLAEAVLVAAPARRTQAGAGAWLRACGHLGQALCRDAAARAFSLVEV